MPQGARQGARSTSPELIVAAICPTVKLDLETGATTAADLETLKGEVQQGAIWVQVAQALRVSRQAVDARYG